MHTESQFMQNSLYFYFYFFVFLPFLGLVPTAYRGSHARGLIGAVALAYARARATWDPSYVCNLRHSSWQRRIFNPLSKARDQTCNLMVPSWIR